MMKQANTSYSWKRDPVLWAYSVFMLIPVIMVFIFYNYYQLNFCVYSGWALLVFSIVLILLAGYEFGMKGGAPEGESLVHTTVLVDSGVYAVVRHPQYLGFICFFTSFNVSTLVERVLRSIGICLVLLGCVERRADEHCQVW